MKTKELLSPVGNMKSLHQAVANGADAVYLGGKKFGARAYADNFTEEEMVSAIKYCHLYGVKIYVTVNTMIYESELEDCLNYIRFLHKNNVDALIMQDLGLIKLVRDTFPNLEIHASTQMHTHNQEQLKLLEQLGIKRVVLARELSLEEIEKFATNLELEIFIHGALCVCYSGQCLFSSLLLNRSGNRGSCAGICRLPFELYKETKHINTLGNYLLSPKELNTAPEFKSIMESNITSLKIEGRMKSPEYVGFLTKLYRNLIDSYYKNKTINIEENLLENLKSLFNRGFTKGYLFNETNKDLMNIKTSNHQGSHLGTVLEITKNKIKIKLNKPLHQEDGIRFKEEDKGLIVNFLYNEKGLLINKANSGDIIYVDNKINLKKGTTVLKTIDSVLMNDLQNLPIKKINIDCTVTAKINEPLIITLTDGANTIQRLGNKVEPSLNNSTSKKVIEEKISSLGNTPFVINHLEITMDENIFIPMSELKNLRRATIEELIEKRENSIPHSFIENEINKEENNNITATKDMKLNVLVRNEEQLKTCLEEKVNIIYVTSESLYEKYKSYENVYLRLSRVKNDFKDYKDEKLLVGESGSLYKYGNSNIVRTDYYFNVANSSCVSLLENFGAKVITLSIENTNEDVQNMMNKIKTPEKVELFLYGRPEVMVMKYCPLNTLVNKDEFCSVCKHADYYFFKDRNNKFYPIKSEIKENHLTHIFHYKELDRIEDLKEYQSMGIENYRIELFNETPEEIKTILCKINECKI